MNTGSLFLWKLKNQSLGNIFTNQLNNNSINHVMSGDLLTDISDHYHTFHTKNVVNYVEMLKTTLTGEITATTIK